MTFVNSNGTEHTCCGKYLVVEPFAELTFTWAWKTREQNIEVVSLGFFEIGHQTRMKLTHKDIDPANSHDYRSGWASTFEKLRTAIPTSHKVN